MPMSRILRFFAVLLPWCFAAGLILFWLSARVPISGVFFRNFVVDGTSPWLNTFLPGQRATVPGMQPEGWIGQRITQEPVYASARVPGAYDALEVGLEFRPTRQPLIELGLANRNEDGFTTVPAWSEVLASGWRRVVTGTVMGYVRADLPDSALTTAPFEAQMTWRSERAPVQRMDTHPELRTYAPSLRGGHDFYFVPVSGVIDLTLALQDVNRNRGNTSVAFRLTQQDVILWTDAVGISGSRDTRPNNVYEKNIHIDHLPAGVYRLSVIADDDVFIRKISTTAEHWVLGPRLYFGDVNGYATSTPLARAWTNSQHLKLDTVHAEGLQDVRLGAARTRLIATHTMYPLERDPKERAGDVLVDVPRSDVRIFGDGYFAFDKDRLFYPAPRRLTDDSDPGNEGVQVIFTPYLAPKELTAGWKRLEARFPITAEAGETVRIAVGAPGIEARGGSIDVRSGFVRYLRPPLSWSAWFDLINREIRAAWHHL